MQFSTCPMFISVKWKDKLGGVRKINFVVDIKISGAFSMENKTPEAFPGQGECHCC